MTVSSIQVPIRLLMNAFTGSQKSKKSHTWDHDQLRKNPKRTGRYRCAVFEYNTLSLIPLISSVMLLIRESGFPTVGLQTPSPDSIGVYLRQCLKGISATPFRERAGAGSPSRPRRCHWALPPMTGDWYRNHLWYHGRDLHDLHGHHGHHHVVQHDRCP